MVITQVDIEKEYEKDKNIKKEDVAALMEWSSKMAHLPTITEYEAMFFLHSCYYRLEPAKATLDTFFTIRTHCPDLFYYDKNNSVFQTQLETMYHLMLPKKTPEGDLVFLIKFKDTNLELFNCAGHAMAFVLIPLLHLYTDGMSNGIRAILDLEGATIGLLARLSPMVLKNFFYYIQEGFPYRLKSLHFIHIVSWIDKLMALIKPFLKKELLDMIHINYTMEDLYKTIPQEVMPNEFGGQSGNLDDLHQKSLDFFMENTDFFLEHNERIVDESKRVGESRNELFGISGSFKKLNVD